jgi:hypothetical protein
MVAIGACAGFFVVPMNALLQHRGHVLMGAGHSIAVQNFNENIGILVMVGLYSFMLSNGLDIQTAIVLFGLFVSGTMVLVMWRHRRNQAIGDLLHLIGVDAQGRRTPGKGEPQALTSRRLRYRRIGRSDNSLPAACPSRG